MDPYFIQMSNFILQSALLKYAEKKKKISPVFMWQIDNATGNIDFHSTPIINTAIIKHYVTKDNEAVVRELKKLEEELDLHKIEDEIISIDQLANNLMQLRGWQWLEKIETHLLNTVPFDELGKSGIYNKAIVFAKDSSPYTKGLVSELLRLSNIPLEECKGTVLYNWINEIQCENTEKFTPEFIELLPANHEQKTAISKALAEDTTVITGPPGTGKSQVVINLIINEVYNNKSVLFCSKNNKAVDVVIQRANKLTKTPFIARLGGQAGNQEIEELLHSVISMKSPTNDTDAIEKKRALYKEYLSEYKLLQSEISEVIATRNKVDKLDYDLERYREKFDKLFKYNTGNSYLHAKQLWEDFEEKRLNAYKMNQSIFNKIRWKLIKADREKLAVDAAKKASSIFCDIGETVPNSFKDVDTLDMDSICIKVHDYINILRDIEAYKEESKKLSGSREVEVIEKDIVNIREKLYISANDYWNVWLEQNHVAISQEDRQTVIEYLTATRILTSQPADFPIPNDVKKLFYKIQEAIPKYLPAQAITLLSVKDKVPFEPGGFDLLIIDEASQCDIASAIPLMYRAKRIAVIGDMRQLPHVSTLSKIRDIELFHYYGLRKFSWLYSTSPLFNLASSLVNSNKVVSLREHHRSHADIIEFSNRKFYGGKLVVATRYDDFQLPNNVSPGIKWIDIKGKSVRPNEGSLINEPEARKIIDELQRFAAANYTGSIGVISPFSKQANRIQEMLCDNPGLNNYLRNNNHIEISTVHKFQGDERDIIIFSPALSKGTTDKTKYFLNGNGNLFNVAITRAKAMLIVVGDQEYCKKCGISYLQDFVEYACSKMEIHNTDSHSNNSTLTSKYPHVSNESQVSEWEKIFYEELYKNGIRTMPQYPADKYKLDLAIISGKNKLDIEVDGKMYHQTWDGELTYRDQLRNQRLFDLGWEVMRFWVPEIRDNMIGCIEKVANWMEKHSIERNLT